MFSTKYSCLNCGEEFSVKKILFKTSSQNCPNCGSKKITKVNSASQSGCGCSTNKKGSRFT